jgi:hypothetical protein
MVTVYLAAALICFQGHCYPALVGKSTPQGSFPMEHALTLEPGYGGDIIAYAQTEDHVLAIHRIWLLGKNNHRLEAMAGPAAGRRFVTNGCINIMPEVYRSLVACCSKDSLSIQP